MTDKIFSFGTEEVKLNVAEKNCSHSTKSFKEFRGRVPNKWLKLYFLVV